jgi:hypothetical protein
MSSEVQEFAERFSAELRKYENHGYVNVPYLRRALQDALYPRGTSMKFPMVLYRSTDQRMVNSSEEEQAAQSEGFTHTPPPQFAPGYPKFFRERLTTEGGTRGWDIRRVMLRTEEELRLFKSVTEESEWTVDAGDQGGRGVGLDQLMQERRELLMSLVGAESFEEYAPDREAVGTPELPCEVIEPATVTGMNPDEVTTENSECAPNLESLSEATAQFIGDEQPNFKRTENLETPGAAAQE